MCVWVVSLRDLILKYLSLKKYEGALYYFWMILTFFFQVKFLEFKVQNIVGTCDLRFPIRVENLNQMHGQFSRCVCIGWKALLQDNGPLHTIQESGWSPLLVWVLWRTDSSRPSAGNWITITQLLPVALLIIPIPSGMW